MCLALLSPGNQIQFPGNQPWSYSISRPALDVVKCSALHHPLCGLLRRLEETLGYSHIFRFLLLCHILFLLSYLLHLFCCKFFLFLHFTFMGVCVCACLRVLRYIYGLVGVRVRVCMHIHTQNTLLDLSSIASPNVYLTA